jgi:hypothetical protein
MVFSDSSNNPLSSLDGKYKLLEGINFIIEFITSITHFTDSKRKGYYYLNQVKLFDKWKSTFIVWTSKIIYIRYYI